MNDRLGMRTSCAEKSLDILLSRRFVFLCFCMCVCVGGRVCERSVGHSNISIDL